MPLVWLGMINGNRLTRGTVGAVLTLFPPFGMDTGKTGQGRGVGTFSASRETLTGLP